MYVEFKNITKKYGAKTALNIPRWSAKPGDVIGLVGSNGAGKTTFLRLVLDLLRVDTGEVLIEGKNVSTHDAWKAHTGSYLDNTFLIDFLTPLEYFKFIGTVYGFENGQVEEAIVPYTNLIPFLETEPSSGYIRELSTGNAKKVGIVSALFPSPKLLLLDEPFSNLDPSSQIRLKQHIRRLAEEKNMTMIISSHDLGHVTEVCSRITLLDRGVVIRDDETSPETLSQLKHYFSS